MEGIATRSLQLGRHIRHMGRLAQISNVFARHGLWSVAERMGLKTWLTPAQVREAQELSDQSAESESADSSAATKLPEDKNVATFVGDTQVKGLPARLRRSFEELGPAFVKLGQVLAVREDLLGADYIEELRKLHTHVAPLPYSVIQDVLKKELGPEKLALFKDINPSPLAAGSIAQVHEATLMTGERVVIKVQRPGIGQQIKVDLSLMEELASLLERFIPETRLARPVAMMAEFKRTLLGELDFVREAGNITKIQRNFNNVDHIVIPEVFWNVSTGKVLTLTQLEGVPAWNRDKILGFGLDPSLLVERGVGMFLKMVYVDGLFHGDLHPGNLLAMPDNRVGVLDFGVAVHMSRATRENLAGLLLALVEEDYDRVVMHYAEIADPALDFNAEAFEHELGNVVAPFIGLTLEGLRTGRLFWDLARAAAKHGAPMPGDLVIFIKTLVSFEGIGTHLDPDFDIMESTQKFAHEIASEMYSPDKLKDQGMRMARDIGQLAKHAPFQIRRLLKAAIEGQLNLQISSDDLRQLSFSMDRSSSRLAISIIIAALIVGSSILTFERTSGSLSSMPLIGLVGFTMAGLLGVYVIWSVMRGGKM
jgi:ubiquinone biosynthesis protein